MHLGEPSLHAELAPLGLDGAMRRVRSEIAARADMPLDDAPRAHGGRGRA